HLLTKLVDKVVSRRPRGNVEYGSRLLFHSVVLLRQRNLTQHGLIPIRERWKNHGAPLDCDLWKCSLAIQEPDHIPRPNDLDVRTVELADVGKSFALT